MRSLFLVTFLVLCHSAMGAHLVKQSCKKAADGDKNFNYKFCVSSLKASPKSKGSDLAGLTGIALGLTTAKGTSITSTISKLMNNPNVDKTALKDCQELYSDAIDGLKQATGAFKSGDYGTALTLLSATINAPESCETGFQERESISPLKKEDGDFTQLNIISLAFINQLKAA